MLIVNGYSLIVSPSGKTDVMVSSKPMSDHEPILNVSNLSVSFENTRVLEGVSFSIERGDFLAVIGPNGSGKTVLVRALLGNLPYEGTITWQPNIKIGYVPQQIDWDRYLSLTLHDFLKLKIRILKLPETAIEKAISQVGLEQKTLAMPLKFLSGGQVQRGLVAFALIGDPDVVFFDEPTASVDTPGEEQIYETLHRLQDEDGLTIILVSHELDLVSKYANKILCLNREMICFGGPELALRPENMKKLYGGKTHVHALRATIDN